MIISIIYILNGVLIILKYKQMGSYINHRDNFNRIVMYNSLILGVFIIISKTNISKHFSQATIGHSHERGWSQQMLDVRRKFHSAVAAVWYADGQHFLANSDLYLWLGV